MWIKLLFSILTSLLWMPTPQPEPVLLNVNGKNISRAEFEYRLNKDKKQHLKGKELKAYLDNYVLEQIKVSAAEQAGLDTMPALRNLLTNYRKQLIGQYVTDGKSAEDKARAVYDNQKLQRGAGEVQITQIFLPLSQNASSRTIEASKQKMDSIYGALQNNPRLFGTLAKRYSAAKDTVWVSSLDCTENVERKAFALTVNQFSEPFYSPQGIHIIKVTGRRDIASFEEMLPVLMRNVNSDNFNNKIDSSIIDRLKQQLGYTPSDEGIKELKRYGETTKTLFTLGGKTYNGIDFKRFAEVHPMEVSAQLDAFISKSVLDQESKRVTGEHPELQMRLKVYRDELLAKAEDQVSQTSPDSVALQNFFEKNESDYRWATPRYNGILLECCDKKTGKKVKKLLKKQPQEEWAKLIAPFNKEKESVRFKQGLFKVGDDAAVDALAFGGPDYTPAAGFPYVLVLGKKQKAPTDYRDAKDRVIADYQNYMQREWLAHLKTNTKVEISEEVLKTVNNH
jgi:peptidyl-prolyl cis-trans isomerase SurA